MSQEHARIRHLKQQWDDEDAVRDELERQAQLLFLEEHANQLFAPRTFQRGYRADSSFIRVTTGASFLLRSSNCFGRFTAGAATMFIGGARPDKRKHGDGRKSPRAHGVALPDKRITLADLVQGKVKGRTSPDQITYCGTRQPTGRAILRHCWQGL
jgi:hypothetical protein